MPNFDSGVKRYIKAQCTVTVFFPVSWSDKAEVACKHCPFYIRATQRCALTQDIVNYPDNFIGATCPLEEIEDVQGNP